MARTAYLLGVDNGGTLTKAALYDLEGRQLAVSSTRTEMLFPEPGHAEKDMDELWRANVRVISEVLALAGVEPGAIAGIAATGHGNGMYLLDSAGRPAGRGINSADTRAAGYVERWYRDGSFQRVLPKTCQSIWPGQPAALLAWFLDRRPEELGRARWVLMCKDYVRFKLTGEIHGELTDWSGTSLVNVREGCHDPGLLEVFGLAQVADKLPPLCRPEEVCGGVSRSAAAETGLKAGTPVAGGLFDIDACAIASGIVDQSRLCLVAGSWSINEFISPCPVQSDELFMTSLYCLPGYWLVLEGSPTSASNLEWFVAELMGGEAGRPGEPQRSVFDLCGEIVAGVAPERSEVVFLPFLYGSNVRPGLPACFLGLRGWHGRAHLLRALYEGVVFSHRTHVDRLRPFAPGIEAARIAGGAANSRVWVQMFADCLEMPIEVPENREQGTLGAALCAGVATGQFASFAEAVRATVRVADTVEPDGEAAACYRDKYERYGRSVAALQALYA